MDTGGQHLCAQAVTFSRGCELLRELAHISLVVGPQYILSQLSSDTLVCVSQSAVVLTVPL